MKTLYMTKGLPASGKTTAAKALVATQPGTKRVNKDDLRAMLDAGKWSPKNEEFILDIRNEIVRTALEEGHHVIVDDTNLAPKHIAWGKNMVKKFHKAKFEIMDFTHVSPEECIKRDLIRPNSVGSKVILDMYNKYLKPAPQVAPAFDPSLDNVVICDIDGTVAKVNGRGFFDWGKVGEDLPREAVIRMIQKAVVPKSVTKLIFVSGRDKVCSPATWNWLEVHFCQDFKLFMRPAGDTRRDSIVKREIYENHIKGRYNVIAIFDDRPQVIRECWQELGFGDRIFNVGTGEEF